jgi:hypothetical protein
VGPCHHGTECSQVTDIEGNYEHIEEAVADSQQGGGPPAWRLGEKLTTHLTKPGPENWMDFL